MIYVKTPNMKNVFSPKKKNHKKLHYLFVKSLQIIYFVLMIVRQ